MGTGASALFLLAACGGGGGGGGGGTPSNTAPTAQAGSDQTITLPTNSVQLQGSATDDGRPTPANITYAWTTTGSNVTFSAASSAATTATFAAAGTYVLTLTVNDGALTGTDTVQVTVNAASNQAPAAQAGADQTIEFPFAATLQGSATDDGPAGSLTYQWSTSTAGVVFANATLATTGVTFPAAGSYTLTLTVSDGTTTGTDDVLVTVDPAMYPAADNDNETVPDRGWTRVNPSDVGMSVTLLDQARDYSLINQAGGTETTGGAGFISRRGRLVYSWGDIDSPRYQLKSATKAVGGIALGLALGASTPLIDLATTGQTYLPTLGTPPANDPNLLDDITILQLATHTAGFEKTMGFGNLVFAPGTAWRYSDGGLNWLADVLTQVHQQDLATLMQASVWSKLGITNDDIRWRADASGRTGVAPHPSGFPRRELASGITANTNAMARVGLLFLRRGVWGTERILTESFVDTVRTPRPENANVPVDASDVTDPTYPQKFPDAPRRHGMLWWTNATGALSGVPTDAYWAWGLGDSLIVVIPSLDLVIARLGNDPDLDPPSPAPPLPRWRNDWNSDYTVLQNFLGPIVSSVTP